jgi:hypothetical protein
VTAEEFHQASWVTQMARRAAADLRAHWVINSDADEFWCARSGTLREAFSQVPKQYGVLSALRYDCISDTSDRPWLERMQQRCARPHSATGRPLPPKVAHRADASISVRMGNHSVSGRNRRGVLHDAIEILHLPARTAAQFEKKIRFGTESLIRSNLDPRICHMWRELYGVLQRDGSLQSSVAPYFRSESELAAAIASGELVRDTRIADALRGSA